jgi:hypothetical protein
VDGVVDLGETVWIGVAAAGIVVLVADFDILHGPGLLAAVFGALGAVGAVAWAEEVL